MFNEFLFTLNRIPGLLWLDISSCLFVKNIDNFDFSPSLFLLQFQLNTGCIKKSRQFRNASQPREAASSMKFFV